MKKIKQSSSSGFTLLELAIVILISGIIMVMLSTFVLTALENVKQRQNKTRFQFVQEEINRFLETQGRFPCPAPLTAAVDTTKFGREALDDCTQNTNVAGTFRVNGSGGRKIRIGAIPTRNLNLLDEYIYDAYGTRFLYAVTETLTSSDNFDITKGAISVEDLNGNSVVQPANQAPYVILSFGENQSGGYSGISGNIIQGGCNASLSSSERENCDNDSTFISSLLSSSSGGNDYFDDRAETYIGTSRLQAMPSGGIMAFDLAKCPQGWQTYSGMNPPGGTVACKKI
ncbi:MAG: type II secretion system GspH family protein [Alphaproteobacteria bacterium]|nr:type II secretion system GspH family protein [Alphaproteobacteria bacterium]